MKALHGKSRPARRLKIFWKRNYAILLTGIFLLVIGCYALHIEPRLRKIREIEFSSPAVTGDVDGLTIAFVADIHLNELQMQELPETIEIINQRKADIILLGGDFVNGNGTGPDAQVLIKYLQKLSAPLGVYAVPGNHDVRRGIEPVKAAFAGSHIKLLQDQNVIIDAGRGRRFNLIGLDYHTNPHRQNDPQRIRQLIEPDMFNLVLTHTPADFKFMNDDVDLVLAGHTHGGQLNIPFLGSVINPAIGRKYNYGLIREGRKSMYVTCGLGSAYAPARLAMRPEIVFITLKNQPEK